MKDKPTPPLFTIEELQSYLDLIISSSIDVGAQAAKLYMYRAQQQPNASSDVKSTCCVEPDGNTLFTLTCNYGCRGTGFWSQENMDGLSPAFKQIDATRNPRS